MNQAQGDLINHAAEMAKALGTAEAVGLADHIAYRRYRQALVGIERGLANNLPLMGWMLELCEQHRARARRGEESILAQTVPLTDRQLIRTTAAAVAAAA